MKIIQILISRLAVGVILLLLSLGVAPVASAQYTGTNGRIIYYDVGVGGTSIKPDGSNLYGHNIPFVNTGFSTRQYVYSPNGTQIAYSIVSGSDAHLYIKASGTTNNGTALTSGAGVIDHNPYFSPDGTKIAFERCTGGSSINCNAFVINTDGTGLTQLTNGMYTDATVRYPIWDSGGTLLYAWITGSSAGGFPGSGIYSFSPTTANQTTATQVVASSAMTSPNTSEGFDINPSNTTFLYQSTSGNLFSIRSILTTGASDTAIQTGADPYRWTVGTYSPDGTMIVAVRVNLSGADQVVVMNADGSNPQAILTGDSVSPGVPSPSASNQPYWGTDQSTFSNSGSAGGFQTTPGAPNSAAANATKSSPFLLIIGGLLAMTLLGLGGLWLRSELKDKK